MDVAIIGAGGVGLGLASCLHKAGHKPLLIVRPPSRGHPLSTHGLDRRGLFGDHRVPASEIRLDDSLQRLSEHPWDFFLICTKTLENERIVAELSKFWQNLARPPYLVLCQNGWGNTDDFASALSTRRVAHAQILTGFLVEEQYRVNITVHASPIQIGSLLEPALDELAPLCEAVDQGGIPCEVSSSIEAELWAKILYNCLLNPLGALVGVPYGELGRSSKTREIMDAAAAEIFRVLDAAGYQTHWPDSASYLEVFYAELLPRTEEHESSMLQDLRAGRLTEIDALCGAVVKLGAAYNVAAPVNGALTTLIHAAEGRTSRSDRTSRRGK